MQGRPVRRHSDIEPTKNPAIDVAASALLAVKLIAFQATGSTHGRVQACRIPIFGENNYETCVEGAAAELRGGIVGIGPVGSAEFTYLGSDRYQGKMIIMLVTLVCATSLRNRVYDTEVTFWQDTATRNPSSARAANNLGMAYAGECRFDEAASEFQRSMRLDAADFRASINLMLLRQGELPGAEANRCSDARDNDK